MILRLAAGFALCLAAVAQTVCPSTPRYSPCDLVFEIPSAKSDQRLDLHAEFRSPRHRTAMMNAFWNGGTQWIIRYTPTETGPYVYRLTSSLPALDGKSGQFTATPSTSTGWLRAANVHHFANVDENVLTPHLWTGVTISGFASMQLAQWKSLVDARSQQHFNHIAVTLVDEANAKSFQSPEFFQTPEEKIRYANQHGMIVDIAFFGPDGLLNKLLPSHDERQKWFIMAISRLAAFDVTWDGLEGWETYDDGREHLKEIGDYIDRFDPYKHTRSSRANSTSAPLLDDGWLRFRSYQTSDTQLGTIEQQVYRFPAVNNFVANTSDTDSFRRRLWNATAAGQYPAPTIPNEEAADQMKIWYEFMANTRHWELEPFFDLEGGRALALEGVEYVIYVEKPGPVTVQLEKSKYDVEWFNPANAERVALKDIKGEVFNGDPPDNSHDWVLHISREGHKASMLKSYKFESREIMLQEVEGNPGNVPFEIAEPSADTLSLSQPAPFRAKLKRETKATSRMMYLWTGEVTVDGRGYRVIGTGPEGNLQIPANIARQYPAALHVHVQAMNSLGKVYALDRNYTLTK